MLRSFCSTWQGVSHYKGARPGLTMVYLRLVEAKNDALTGEIYDRLAGDQ